MHKTSLVDLFNAGLTVRKVIINNNYYRQDREEKKNLISSLLSELNQLFEFNQTPNFGDLLNDHVLSNELSVTRFLLQYAEIHELCESSDVAAWSFTVFFIASPVVCLRGVRKGYFVGAKFMPDMWNKGWMSVGAARAMWFEMFEKYMWDVQEVKLAAEAVANNSRMVQVFNDIVPNAYKIPVSEPDMY